MGFFQKFPYTDEHQLNLDWILRLFKTLHGGTTGQILKKRSNKDFDWEWSEYSKAAIGLGNVDNIRQYSADNPPPYPITSVSGKTGAVTLDAGDVAYDSTDTYASGTVGNAIKDLSDVVDTKIGFQNRGSVTYFNRENVGVWGDPNLAKTRRWFFDKIIPEGAYIDKIVFSVVQTVNDRVFQFEIWEKNDNTLSKVKTVSVTTQSPTIGNNIIQFTATLDYTATSDCMISVLCPEYNSIIYEHLNATTNTMLASADIDPSTTILSYSTLGTWYMDISATLYVITDVKVNIVLIGPGMDYEEIQDAILGITDDSASNPYTLLVMPKGTPYQPFSMIRDNFDDAYPWSGISPRFLSIIGVDKAHCVIRSDSGDYKRPCGEPMTNGLIKNLTFVMTNDSQTATATQGGYCLHIDCRTSNDVGYTMSIEDCDFSDASGPCLGIGMHKNCTLIIKQCNFKTTLDDSYNPHAGYTNLYNYGVVFCHTSTLDTATDQKISFKDCFGVCAKGNKSLWISTAGDYDPLTASFYYTLLRNVFWNETQNAPAYSISGALTADPWNYGNNITP